VHSGQPVDRQVYERNVLAGEVVDEGRERDSIGAPLVAEVVDARLPADEILHVPDGEVESVEMNVVIAGGGGAKALIRRADRHGVDRVVIGVAGGDDVERDRRVLDRLRSQAARKGDDDQRAGRERRQARHEKCSI
jgi:hypothetical protein